MKFDQDQKWIQHSSETIDFLNVYDYYLQYLQAIIFCLFFRKCNDAVYKVAFAKSQEAYDEGLNEVFDALDKVSCFHVVVWDYKHEKIILKEVVKLTLTWLSDWNAWLIDWLILFT